MENSEAQILSTTLMLDMYADSMLSETLRELRTSTAAFLTDRYHDGTYVATADDIAELQEATVAFLADCADGKHLCVNNAGQGLLLPGEQFLLPVPIAVERVRATNKAATDVINLIDECLDAQTSYDGMSHTPRLDATVDKDLEAIEVQKASPCAARLGQLPPTIKLDEERFSPQENFPAALENPLESPGETNRLLVMDRDVASDHTDDDEDTTPDDTGPGFDASDRRCRFLASNAASFFDTVADTVVPYVSLDQLLEMDDRCMQLDYVQQISERDTDGYVDGSKKEIDEHVDEMVHMNDDDSCVGLGGIDAICNQCPPPPTVDSTKLDELKVIIDSTTIRGKENVPCSVASNYTMDFADHRVSLTSLESRRGEFLDDESGFPLSKAGAARFNDFFANDVWTNSPDLDLALPVSQLSLHASWKESKSSCSQPYCSLRSHAGLLLDRCANIWRRLKRN